MSRGRLYGVVEHHGVCRWVSKRKGVDRGKLPRGTEKIQRKRRVRVIEAGKLKALVVGTVLWIVSKFGIKFQLAEAGEHKGGFLWEKNK